jgi:hypothetical protein
MTTDIDVFQHGESSSSQERKHQVWVKMSVSFHTKTSGEGGGGGGGGGGLIETFRENIETFKQAAIAVLPKDISIMPSEGQDTQPTVEDQQMVTVANVSLSNLHSDSEDQITFDLMVHKLNENQARTIHKVLLESEKDLESKLKQSGDRGRSSAAQASKYVREATVLKSAQRRMENIHSTESLSLQMFFDIYKSYFPGHFESQSLEKVTSALTMLEKSLEIVKTSLCYVHDIDNEIHGALDLYGSVLASAINRCLACTRDLFF